MNTLVLTRRALVVVAVLVVAAASVLALPTPYAASGADALRLVLLVYVSVLGALVATYAATNLRGQARQGRFAGLLAATVVGLLAMVTAEDLTVAAVGWTISGWATAGLVAHRGDARARRASRTVASRLLVGDLALWSAVAVWHGDGDPEAVGLLIAAAVVVRSALAPAQRWLPETAEAPSPVSALLHAGVVNGGAMFALLFWPLLAPARGALVLLIVAGLVSVAVGLATMRLRPDVKGRLAASTTAQMGLVAVQLGLALPAAALLHVLGHGAWKAWLFLRAGGTVERARRALPTPSRTSTPATLLAAAAALATAGLGLAAGTALDVAGSMVLPAVLLAVVATVGVREAARLERTGRGTRLAWGLVATAVPTAYLAWVAVVDHATLDWFGSGPDPAAPLVALAVAAVVVTSALVAARVRPASSGPVATALAATLLPPGSAVRGRLGAPAPSGHDPHPGGLPVTQLGTVVELAATAVGPTWPLRSMVASNPIAPLEKLAVEDAASTVRLLHGRDPRPRLQAFLDLHADGVLTSAALRRSLTEHAPVGAGTLSGASVGDLVELTRAVATDDVDVAPLPARACDSITDVRGRTPAEVLDLQVAAWAARAWGSAGSDPWTLWRSSARHRIFDVAWQVRGASALASTLPDDPALAVAALWPRVQRLVGDRDLYTYLARALTAGRGWAGHARWRARRDDSPLPLLQLVALHLALDVLVAEAALSRGARRTPPTLVRRSHAATALELVGVWQRALDLSARDGLLRGLTAGAGAAAEPAQVQSVWCIDTRSERLRRHLESRPGHQTFGYAGFFGAAVRHRDADGRVVDRYPGPLAPALDLLEPRRDLPAAVAGRRLAARVAQTPAAALAWAELSGVPAMAGSLAATLAPARLRSADRAAGGGSPRATARLPHDVAVAAAEGLLRLTGLGERVAPVVVLVGHGSSTENNAFASAYDCGACGGNPGAVNATLVAEALADPAVRADLAERGLHVPAATVVVAALHDTTTDRVTLLRGDDEPDGVRALLDVVAVDLDRAAADAATERAVALPRSGRRRGSLRQRAADWAEPMPEWGLAGNMALVVGPRALTRALDLGGTAFLHSYEPDLDPDGSLLEQIMCGPVVVTQWISSQYYFAAAAPDLLGAGDKTTHNVVGDVGVISGAHGDLRTGLPWQAVASRDPATAGDASHLRHLPVRHLVVVAADPRQVRDVVTRTVALHQAVGNGWMQLVALDPTTGALLELDRHLEWVACPVPGVPAAPSYLTQRS